MFTLLAAAIAIACIAASAKRLLFAASPTALDPTVLLQALRGDNGKEQLARVREVLRRESDASWERELLVALETEGPARAAYVNEQLTELDYRAQRWARVPRVCASIASSAGFLLAAMTLRAGLLGLPVTEDGFDREAVDGAIFTAINVAAFGVVGAVTCVAIHIQSRRMAKERLQAADKLVERLEALLDKAEAFQ
jgi:hypothetical protein